MIQPMIIEVPNILQRHAFSGRNVMQFRLSLHMWSHVTCMLGMGRIHHHYPLPHLVSYRAFSKQLKHHTFSGFTP